MVADSDGVIGFSYCQVSITFSIVLLRFVVAGRVDFDPWPCWWAPLQGYF